MKNATFTFGLPKSKLMVVLLKSAPVVNQQYFFQQDNEITGMRVKSIDLLLNYEMLYFIAGNVDGTLDGYNFLNSMDLSSTSVYLSDASGHLAVEHQPALLFWSGNTQLGPGMMVKPKKIRTNLKVDPASSFIIFKKPTVLTTYPAVFALNVTLAKR